MMGNLTQTMSDGVPLIVWGFTGVNNSSFNGDTTRLCPGPVIEMIEGQPTSVTLISTRPHTLHLHGLDVDQANDHTLHLHGLDVDQANDGVPSTSGYVTRMLPPFLPPPPGVNLGEVFSYQLIAPHAGTYMYHCHVDTVLHMEMGMSGTIVVRPPDGRKDVLYANGPAYDREYIWQLHTFDSTWHTSGLSPISGPGYLRYTPDYFMINGRDGADILNDSASAIVGSAGQQIVIRLVNIGYMPAVVNLGGIPFEVLCSDGRPLQTPMPNRVNDWMVAPGERYDVRFTMPQAGQVTAAVNYLDILGLRILGSALSTITTL
jgi:FtsP/CotA-like multicopper oxidase with cupredoxin domain